MSKTTERVRYVGRYECGVDVAMGDGRWDLVPHGGELVTTAAHAESLLTQQGEWERVPTPRAKTMKEEDSNG